jgi:archaellin
MEVRGGVVVNATTIVAGPPEEATVGTIQWSVATTAGGEPVPLDPASTSNRTVIAYRDAAIVLDDVTYTATEITGDGDLLLEPGELFTVSVAIADITGATLNPNDRFTFELQTPVGAVIDLTRSLPADLDAVMQLH